MVNDTPCLQNRLTSSLDALSLMRVDPVHEVFFRETLHPEFPQGVLGSWGQDRSIPPDNELSEQKIARVFRGLCEVVQRVASIEGQLSVVDQKAFFHRQLRCETEEQLERFSSSFVVAMRVWS